MKTLFSYVGKKPPRIGKEVVEAFRQSGCSIFVDLFCGSIAMLSNIFEEYGADSYIGRCACMIVDGSDTIFYMAGVYFGGLKLKKVWVVVVLALVVSLVGASLGCLLCKVM